MEAASAVPGMKEEDSVERDDGEIPTRKPRVTSAAAARTRADGDDRVASELTVIVNGSWRPRAICIASVS